MGGNPEAANVLDASRRASKALKKQGEKVVVPAGKFREITLEELQQHNGKNGTMWTAIRNKVYDITKFYPSHPGGEVMRIGAGREATCLFESYHPSMTKINDILGSDLVPQVGVLAGKAALPDSALEDKFFTTCKQRVQSYLKNQQIPFHFYPSVAMAELVLSFVGYFIVSYYMIFQGYILAAVLVGFFTGRLGFLMHSGNHRSTSQYQWINRIAGIGMDLAGSSHVVWEHEHQVAHHMDPNETDKDNDCSIGYVFIRFHPDLEWKWWHRMNHWITVIGMTGGLAKWVLTDFPTFQNSKIGSVSMHITKIQWAEMFFWKFFLFFRYIAIPWYLFGLPRALLLFGIVLAVGAHYIENIFIVNHIQHDCAVPPVEQHWAVKQIWATCNWASESVFWNWFSGGLNHQIEHHLFPSMSTYNYPYISPIVRETCKEFGIPYQNHLTFSDAWFSMFDFLRRLGQPDYKKKQHTL